MTLHAYRATAAAAAVPQDAIEILPGDAPEPVAVAAVDAPARAEAARHGIRVLAILSALMGFASISTDLYLPAMPVMAGALRSDTGAMEMTISGYLIGFSLGQLLWGPIGDRYGRRLPVVIGLVLFVLGSAGCALSTSAEMMIGWRVLQAVGACAGVVLARAMVRDLYEGDRASQMLSTLMTVMAIAPLIGPIVGGQILVFASWQAIFWTLVGVGLLTLVAIFALPETLPPERRNREPLVRALADYAVLLRQPRLMAYAGAGAFFYGGIYAYIAGTPFAYISYYHVPPQFYGLLFAAGIVGIMATNIVNARLVMRLGSVNLLRAGTGAAALAGIVIAVDAATGWGGLMGLAVPLFVFVGLTGFIVANSIGGALASFPTRAGAVSALVGSLQYGTGIAGSAMVGAFAGGTPWTMGWVIGLAGIGSALCAWLIVPAVVPISR
ncbi:MAG: drug transporter protein [Hyphomicrobiales bacterium]|nr:drug transporter protein [Hyphomicrobiales bacterium]